MLRWAIQHQAIVIPKSSREERIQANAQVFDFALSDTDMRILNALDRTNTQLASARARAEACASGRGYSNASSSTDQLVPASGFTASRVRAGAVMAR